MSQCIVSSLQVSRHRAGTKFAVPRSAHKRIRSGRGGAYVHMHGLQLGLLARYFAGCAGNRDILAVILAVVSVGVVTVTSILRKEESRHGMIFRGYF